MPDQTSRRKADLGRVGVVAVMISALVMLDSGAVAGFPRMCLWHALTGTDCPFCGLTRSLIALGDMRLSLAFELHPFGPITAIILVGYLTVTVTGLLTGGPGPAGASRKAIRIMGTFVGICWLAWWLATLLSH